MKKMIQSLVSGLILMLFAALVYVRSLDPSRNRHPFFDDNLDALTATEGGVVIPCVQSVSVCSFPAYDATGRPITIEVPGMKGVE